MIDMKSGKPRHARAPALEWLGDLSGQAARITSMGSNMLLVENHCGICSFSDECILISTRKGCLKISGHDLTLCQVRPDALIVRGCIAAIALPCIEDDGHEP